MVHDVPGIGMKWITAQYPGIEFHSGDIRTMRKYLEMLHKQGLFRFVQKCEIYKMGEEDYAGFCVDEGAGCGNTAGMMVDIAELLYNTSVGKETPFDLEQADIMRMRILLAATENSGFAGRPDSVYIMRCKIEEGRYTDEREAAVEIRHNCLNRINPYKYGKYYSERR